MVDIHYLDPHEVEFVLPKATYIHYLDVCNIPWLLMVPLNISRLQQLGSSINCASQDHSRWWFSYASSSATVLHDANNNSRFCYGFYANRIQEINKIQHNCVVIIMEGADTSSYWFILLFRTSWCTSSWEQRQRRK